MIYTRTRIDEQGKEWMSRLETSSAHVILEQLGYVSEEQRDREKRIPVKKVKVIKVEINSNLPKRGRGRPKKVEPTIQAEIKNANE